MKNIAPFWLFTIAVFAALLLPTLVQQGMFLDGTTYAAISNNMANGLGTAFKPHYTQTLYPVFYEHPPLVFILQSAFFQLFGDGFMTEKIYSLFMAALTACGIFSIWRLVAKTKLHFLAWLPILLWVATPLVFWAYRNNLLENTVSVCTTFATFFILKALQNKQHRLLFVASILLVAGFLSKGLVALFPLAIPLFYGMVFSSKRAFFSIFWVSGWTFGVLAIAYFSIPALQENLNTYFGQQVFPALANEREVTTSNRFRILIQLITELIAPLVLSLFVWHKSRKTQFLEKTTWKWAVLLLLIGAAASLPLLLTLKQRKFYLLPSIPLYILATSLIIAPYLSRLSWRQALLVWVKRLSIGVLLLVLVFMYKNHNTYARNARTIHDVRTIATVIQRKTVIGTTAQNWENWGLHAYFARFAGISLDQNEQHPYFLVEKTVATKTMTDLGYEEVSLPLRRYRLFYKKHVNH